MSSDATAAPIERLRELLAGDANDPDAIVICDAQPRPANGAGDDPRPELTALLAGHGVDLEPEQLIEMDAADARWMVTYLCGGNFWGPPRRRGAELSRTVALYLDHFGPEASFWSPWRVTIDHERDTFTAQGPYLLADWAHAVLVADDTRLGVLLRADWS